MSATPKGVENPRRAALADIVKSRTENLVDEIKEAGGDTTDLGAAVHDDGVDPRKPADLSPEAWNAMSDEEKGNAIASANAAASEVQETDEQKAERESAEAKAEEERKAAESAGKKYKGKVDGQEVEFEEQAVIDAGLRALQKESAADKRLEEATKAKEEAIRLREVVEAASRAQQPSQQKTDQEVLLTKDALRGIVKRIQYGTEDDAAEALHEYGLQMAKVGQQPQLTEAELMNILDLREARSFVAREFPEITKDQKLKTVFEFTVNQKLAAGDKRSYQEICKETVDEVKQWKAPAVATPTPPAGGSRQAAVERKKTIVSIPAAQARQPAPTPQPAANPSNVIADMRKARGQA